MALNAESVGSEQPKLFAVYLGGRAPKCNTELHDVVFAVGASIEDTYDRLLELWFGSPEGLILTLGWNCRLSTNIA